ncbi:NAD(P)/FAD-dependent oxidoreductase [Nonomuraea ferruginea]|uniref:NAD(P)/FAD-dependent oxidoreductase n=1 Tax=Nonomuraea ferruginea TaxID=46174 RepID=UPI003617F8D4
MRVVVIGSGIVGAAAAHRLSGRGVPVTVVDGAYPGQATQAGAGIVCPWVDHPDDEDWYRLTREGARRYPGLVSSLGESLGYARVGALLVAGEPSDLEPVRALLARRHAEAPEMGDVVDVAAPSVLFPPLAEDLSALLVPGAARVDGRAVRDALLRAALRQGAELRTGTATLTSDGGVLVRAVREADSHGRVTGLPGAPADRESWRQATPGSPQGPPSAHGTHPASEASPSGATRDAAAGAPHEPRSPYGDEPGAGGEGTLVEADVVIVAAGAWSGEVCRGSGWSCRCSRAGGRSCT